MAENIFLDPNTQNTINTAVKTQVNRLLYNTEKEFNNTLNQASRQSLIRMADLPGIRKTSPLFSNWTVRNNPLPFNTVNGKPVYVDQARELELKSQAQSALYSDILKQENIKKQREQLRQKIIQDRQAVTQATVATPEKITQASEFAKQSARYEFVQMGLMLANQVAQSITQGFERSASIAESMYKEMANRAIGQGNWDEYISAKRNELFEIQKQTGSQYFSGLISGAARTGIYTKLLGPIGLAVGALDTGLQLFGTSQQQSIEREKIKEEIAYRSRQIYQKSGLTAQTALQSIAEENELANLKKQLSDTNTKASYYVKMQIVETEKANKELEQQLADLKTRIDRVKQQSGNEKLLLDLEKESANLVQQRATNVSNINKLKSLDEAYEKQESLKEAARLRELEQQRIEEANNLAARNMGKRYFTDIAIKEAAEKYKDYQAMLMEQHGLEKGGNLAWRDNEGNQTEIAGEYIYEITNVQDRLRESLAQFDILKKKLDENVATADEVRQLINLSKEIQSDKETLKYAEDTINARPQFEMFKEQSKAMVEQMSRQIQSSSFMSDNLGSFNQYFGKTDGTLNLISETNSLLKNILTAVENVPKDLCITTVWQ